MPVGRNGIRRILEGVVNFHQGLAPLVSKDTPIPRHVMINCVDPRYSPSKYAQLSINEMFLLRNAGNLVPHSSFVDIQSAATEPAVLELAFTMFEGVKQVAMCGHSDCKAMKFLHSMKDDPMLFQSNIGGNRVKKSGTPLRTWIVNHGTMSLFHFIRLKGKDFSIPLMLNPDSPHYKAEVWIDPENKYDDVDKLSMINSLVQLENVASYSFMKPGLSTAQFLLHSMWFDIKENRVMVFSRSEKRFIPVEDSSTVDLIVKEALETSSKLKHIEASIEEKKKTIEAAIEATRYQTPQCDVEEFREYSGL